jgi:hypothetical protein
MPLKFIKSSAVFIASAFVLFLISCAESKNGDDALTYLLRFGQTRTNSGTLNWTRIRGGPGNDVLTSLAVDKNGYAYSAGVSSVAFDGQSVTGAGQNLFFVKHSPAGAWQWTRFKGGLSSVTHAVVALDSSGNIFIAGGVAGSIDGAAFGGGASDMFLMKFDINGIWQWTKLRGSIGDESAYSIAIDGSDVYVAGTAGNSFDGQTFLGGPSDAFVVKYDTSGSWQWTRLIGGPGADEARGICIVRQQFTSSAGLYAAGYTNLAFAGTSHHGGANDAFIYPLTVTGIMGSPSLIGGSGDDRVTGIAGDNSGSVYVCGYTSGAINGEAHSGGTNDAFVVKSSGGIAAWTRLKGNGGDTRANGICYDGQMSIYVTGITDVDIDTLICRGGTDALAMMYSSSGTLGWIRLRGNIGNEVGIACGYYQAPYMSIAASSLYISGYTDGSFDGQTVFGFNDAFICSFF